MAVAERLGRLGRIGLDEEGIRMRQRHREVVQLALDPADDAKRLAEVHLRVPGGCVSGTNTSRVRRFFSRI
jgi:4'-phosphopantetheinyl transferase EntD